MTKFSAKLQNLSLTLLVLRIFLQVITLNGVNCYQRIDRQSEPFQLAVGDNYLEYDADGNYTNLDVNLFYTPKYLGV